MDETHQKSLLGLARETMSAVLTGRFLPDPAALPEWNQPFGGVFVTLRNRGRLRGCMGRFDPEESLVVTVQQMARSVLEDPRFGKVPVTLEELPLIRIEISVLSALERTMQPQLLIPGTHGVYVRRGPHSGCFLPQVAVEQRWDALQLLSRCCETKAMLSADAWRDPETHVYLFSALVFMEPSEA
jgi:AmmeMemoRadiSam system protein A